MEPLRFVAQRELTPGLMGGFHDLRAEGEPCPMPSGRRLLHLLHLSDIQLADVKSPARYEWVNSFFGVPGFEELIPGYRAQEFLVAHALVAMLRQFNEMTDGQERVCCIVTGDSIDNSQQNELDNFVAAIGGGVVNLQSGDEAMTLVAAHGFGDSTYWHPEPGDDDYKKLWGFPTLEGLLAAAFGPIVSPGLNCDWYITNGNHELLVQGLGVTNAAAGSIVVGETKQIGPPDELDSNDALRLGVESPAALLHGGRGHEIVPDLNRRFIDRRTLAKAIRNAGGTPDGHGLVDDEHLYYSAELNDEVLLIGLDTAFGWGGAEGAIDTVQARWLVKMLERYSSSSFTDDGELIRSDGEDRLIIVAAHHPLSTLTNERAATRPDFQLGDWLLATLLRFPNVIAFVNGHTHENQVRVHHGNGRQLLEVTTSALMDWPCEARSLEITVDQEAIWVTGTMVNFDGVATPRSDDLSTEGIAAWHRLLAANSPALTLVPHLEPEGKQQDRTFRYRIERPSWLRP